MTISAKKSLPGKHRIIHGKASYDPKRPFIGLKEADELGILQTELIISPLHFRTIKKEPKTKKLRIE